MQTFNYNIFRGQTDFTDERGNVETYLHQKNGLLQKQIHDDRSYTKTTWGAIDTPQEFLMTSTTDERGAIETFTYYGGIDPAFKHGQLKESKEKHYPQQSATALVTAYDYFQPANQLHMALLKSTIVDAVAGGANLKTSFLYNDDGRLTSTADAEAHDAAGTVIASRSTVRSYYASGDGEAYRTGLLKSVKQPAILDLNGAMVVHETVFDYDPAGNVYTTTTDGITTMTRIYDSLGNVRRTRDAANVVTDGVYDALGRLKESGYGVLGQTIDPRDAFVTRYKYDAMGRVRESTDALGRITRFEYDRQGHVVKQINPDLTEITHAYDAFGNCIAKTDALGRTTRYVYDSRNRVVQTIHPDGATERVRYDGVGNVVASIDETGLVAKFTYDAAGRLRETTLPDPDGASNIDHGPDLGELKTTNKYDKLGNLVETIDPNGNLTQYKYDKLGRVVQSYALDNVTGNRSTNSPTTLPSSYQLVSLATTEYDAVGNASKTVAYDVSQYNLTATPTLVANPSNEVNAANQTSGKVQVVSARYDAFGRPTRTTVAEGSPVQAVTQTQYDGAGRVRFQIDEAGSKTEFIYDTVTGRLLQAKLPDPNTGQISASSPTTTYQYDGAGNRTAVTDPRGYTTRFQYDVFNRVATTTDPLGGRSRSVYDAAGQMIAAIDPLGRASYIRYDERGRAVLQRSADPDGANPARAASSRFAYDPAGRLVEQVDPLGLITRYVYDAAGRMIQQQTIVSQVVDDGDAGFGRYDGGDTLVTVQDPAAYGGDYTTVTQGAPGSIYAEAAWTFDNLTAGVYKIAATWLASQSLGTWARIRISLDGGPLQDPGGSMFGVNPSQAPSDIVRYEEGAPRSWRSIPQFTVPLTDANGDGVADLHSLRIVAIAGQGYPLRADAMRIERIDPVTFARDANGNVLAQTDELGRTTDYAYDELDRVFTTTLPDPDGASPLPRPHTTRTYDGYGNLVKSIERNATSGAVPTADDVATVFGYDQRNRLNRETLDSGGADQKVTEYVYDAVGNLIKTTELPGHALQRTTQKWYDRLNRLIQEATNSDGDRYSIGADERNEYYGYDAVGNRTTVHTFIGQDTRQMQTIYAYDPLGRVTVETDKGIAGGALQSRTTRYHYDAVGNLTATIDPLGRLSRSEYDRLDRLVKSIDPDPDGDGSDVAHVMTYQYDVAGNLVAETNGAGHTERFAYDSRGLLVRSTDGRGDQSHRRYDAAGNLVALFDPAGNATFYASDGLDRLVREATASGSRTSAYDARGNLAVTVDRTGRVVERLYDRLGRKTREQWYAPGATVPSTSYSDQLTWVYDALGRLQEDRQIHYSAPLAIDYRVTRSYQYDGLDRLRETSNQSLINNAAFRSATAPGAPTPESRQTYSYAYENGELVETREQWQGPYNAPAQFAAQTKSRYNAFGELVKVEDRDTNGSGPSAILEFATREATFSYWADGALGGASRGMAELDPLARALTYYGYDGAGRLASLEHQLGYYGGSSYETVLQFAYGYDAASRIESVAADWATWDPALATRADEALSFTYDAAGQLTGDGSTAAYGYSPGGNRSIAVEPVGGLDLYTPGPQNRVSQDSTYSYLYDNEGNLIERRLTSGSALDQRYTWDHRNRLVKVENYAAGTLAETVHYRYDAGDDLVYRSVVPAGQAAQAEHYVVEGGRRTLAFEQDGDLKRRYQYGPTGEVLFDQVFDATGNPTLQAEQDLLLPLGDHQHSTRLVVGSDGFDAMEIRQSIDYAPFGRVTAIRDAAGALVQNGAGQPDLAALDTVFAHHGSLLDAETGLQHKGERWYSPDLGRFVSEDPIQDGSNWYAFAGNNPVTYADPTGLYQQGHPLQGGSRAFDNSIRQLVNNPVRTPAPTTRTAAAARPAATPSEDRGIVTLPLARPTLGPVWQPASRTVRQITPGAPIVPRDVRDLPGVQAALSDPNRYIIANHSNQGYNVGAPDGSVRFVPGDDYLPIDEKYRRASFEAQSAGGRAAFADMVGEGLISISPLHETSRDAAIAGFGYDYYNPNRHQSFSDRHTAGMMFFMPGGNSGQVRKLNDALDAINDARRLAPSVSPSGGRLGSTSTRAQVADIQAELESRGWTVTRGGALGEEYLPGPNNARRGSAYPDITATKNSRVIRINTTDTLSDALTPTTREARNATKIRQLRPDDHLLLVPKQKP